MAKTKVLITVKTYPAISKKYDELVCTAGFREDGSWIRIYPIQFRKRSYAEQYKKYDWIELDLIKNNSDFRPESFRPVSHETPIIKTGEIKPDGDTWEERRNIVLRTSITTYPNLLPKLKTKKFALLWLFLNLPKFWILFTKKNKKEHGRLINWPNFSN
jgi:hypothetical protein